MGGPMDRKWAVTRKWFYKIIYRTVNFEALTNRAVQLIEVIHFLISGRSIFAERPLLVPLVK